MPFPRKLPTHVIAKWKEIIYLDKKINYFLVLIIPFLHHIEHALKTSLKRYPQVTPWLDDDFLDNLIHTQAKSVLLPIILQTCTLEMHVARRHKRLIGKTPTERFNYFIKALAEKESREVLLHKYPIMRQKLKIVSIQLIDVFLELFQRLNKDSQELDALFFKGDGKYLQLMSIVASGDRHQRGRCVFILSFANRKKPSSEIKLVYKPHSMKIDSAFQQFLEKFNACSGTLALKTIVILEKYPSLAASAESHLSKQLLLDSYGYCKFIAIKPCLSTKEVADFYFRLGMLLMLTYLFLGFDLHCENILAQGEHPFLIDYECLLTPRLAYTKQIKKRKYQQHNVLDMHLLPFIESTDIPNVFRDLSGINSNEDIKITSWKWVNTGKDTMYIKQLKLKLPKIGNRVQLKGIAVSISDYENDFLNGFKTAYHVILNQYSTLLDSNGALKAFKQARIRVIPRATQTYANVLHEQHFPKNLLNQKVNRLHLKKLDDIKKLAPEFKALIPSEKADLFAETIPYFYSITDESLIYNSQGQVCHLESRAGYELFLEHLNHNINLKDMQQQSELIKVSFLANRINNAPKTLANPPYTHTSIETAHLWSITTQKQEAIKPVTLILDNLMDTALYSGDDIFWPYFEPLGNETYSVQLTENDLYDGISGILLPFAYAGLLLHVKDYQKFSQDCLKTLRSYLRPPLPPNLTLGFTSGIGGFLYVFKLIQSLGYPVSIKNDLKPLFDLVPKCMDKNQIFDLISGITGGIAGFLVWYKLLPDDLVLTAIKHCVQHLLDNYPDPAILPKDLADIASQPLLGLAHGVTGMIWILSKCNAILKDHKLDLWLRQAIRYEREQFKIHKGIWPDYRIDLEKEPEVLLAVPTIKSQMVGWCTGPSGIGLAKIATLPPYKDGQFIKEIRTAANQLLLSGISNDDCLCHGNLGNMELLFALAKQTNNVQDIINAQAFSQAVCKQIAKKIKHPTENTPIIPGLFKGDAGIAYGLLRIAFSEEVPNLLIADTKQP